MSLDSSVMSLESSLHPARLASDTYSQLYSPRIPYTPIPLVSCLFTASQFAFSITVG